MSIFRLAKIRPRCPFVGFTRLWSVSTVWSIFEPPLKKIRWGRWRKIRLEDGLDCSAALTVELSQDLAGDVLRQDSWSNNRAWGEDLWILHCFFCLPGPLNDINVLPRSHFLARIASGDALACNYTINDHDCTIGYYFVDGIYPDWETFVKTMRLPDSWDWN
jgi:hypothetical protein